MEWAGHEVAAGLTWTPPYADRELGFALALVERLPLVFAALRQGLIDRGKAWVFADYLDPSSGDLTEEQSRRLCEKFVPLAPGLTTKQLADRLYRALHAIDPELRRRRYRRAVQSRGVALYLDPRTGTATLVGSGLPPAEAAAGAERLDRLVEKAKRAGHPGRRAQISADLYLGMLTGAFHGLTEDEIIARLLAMPRPEDHTNTDRDGDLDTADDDADQTAADSAADDSPPDPADSSGTRTGADDDQPAHADQPADTGRVPASPDDPQDDRWAGDRIATREGIEIRVGFATLVGLDDRPGEIPGLGPIGAGIARDTVAAQRRGASWKFAIVDAQGYLLLAGPIRRRPRTHRDTRPGTGRVRGGVVELHLSVDELQRYAADPALREWHGMLAEIAEAWDHRDEIRKRLAAHPGARFARGPLADHVRARGRYCCGPGCTRSARHSDLDHTLDHARGGRTIEINIGPACRLHHPDKDRGWRLSQPEPGLFRWVSPLGRVYVTRGEPIRFDLPDPEPAEQPDGTTDGETDAEVEQRLRRYDPRILERPTFEAPRPPPKPDPPPDDEPPPF